MSETQDPRKPVQTPENKDKSGRHLTHLEAKRAQNLRDNLMRRKAQARARADDDTDPKKPA
jgi:hypothetical protein